MRDARLVHAGSGSVVADRIEVASSFWARFRGLMGRRELAFGAGLWLPETKSIHMFFMRFPIDAVFLGPSTAAGTRRILSVRRRLAPWRGIVWWVRGADACLELPAGTADSAGIHEGDEVRVEGT